MLRGTWEHPPRGGWTCTAVHGAGGGGGGYIEPRLAIEVDSSAARNCNDGMNRAVWSREALTHIMGYLVHCCKKRWYTHTSIGDTLL